VTINIVDKSTPKWTRNSDDCAKITYLIRVVRGNWSIRQLYGAWTVKLLYIFETQVAIHKLHSFVQSNFRFNYKIYYHIETGYNR